MSNNPDRLTDDVIAQFLRARSADPHRNLLGDIVRTAGGTPQDRPSLGLGPILLPRRVLLLVALALLLATMGAIAVGSRLLQPDVPADQMTLIHQVLDSVNGRDAAALRSAIAVDAALELPEVDSRAGREGKVFMSEWRLAAEDFPEVWMGSLDKWALAAELGSCRPQSESTVSCAVVTRWHVLQMEIGEEWTFDFDGSQVTRFRMARVDPDPPNRVLPLGLGDLDRWKAWLRETHPEQANRLLPTEPDFFGHFYFRLALDASPEEIGASVREYVASRR